MRIIWDETTRREWQELLARVPKSNLLNTWGYAHAVRLHRQMMSRFGIIEVDGKARGLIEVQEAGLGKLIHALTFHRGPLWLDEAASTDEWQQFLSLYTKTFPARLGHMRRFLPEMEDSPQARAQLVQAGFKRVGEGYQTCWLDLHPQTEDLRKGLKGNWRNQLNRAEKSGLAVEEDFRGERSQWLLSRYGADKAERNYGGPRPKFVSQLVADFVRDDDVIILRAKDGDEPVAGIMIFQHGTAATFQIGWSGTRGRETQAHNLLLWHAITLLKSRGITWFDLGGINPEDADGVTKFKQGLGGEAYQTVGLYK
jgi:hypothetical protein